MRRDLLGIDFRKGLSGRHPWLVEFLRVFELCGNDHFPTLNTRRIFREIYRRHLTTECATTAGVHWVWQFAVIPRDLGFRALEKDRDRSTGFLVWVSAFRLREGNLSGHSYFLDFSFPKKGGALIVVGWVIAFAIDTVRGFVTRLWGRALVIRSSRKLSLQTYNAAGYAQTFALETEQRVRHILPHREVVKSSNNPFLEG